jgi:hypothetical protein
MLSWIPRLTIEISPDGRSAASRSPPAAPRSAVPSQRQQELNPLSSDVVTSTRSAHRRPMRTHPRSECNGRSRSSSSSCSPRNRMTPGELGRTPGPSRSIDRGRLDVEPRGQAITDVSDTSLSTERLEFLPHQISDCRVVSSPHSASANISRSTRTMRSSASRALRRPRRLPPTWRLSVMASNPMGVPRAGAAGRLARSWRGCAL